MLLMVSLRFLIRLVKRDRLQNARLKSDRQVLNPMAGLFGPVWAID